TFDPGMFVDLSSTTSATGERGLLDLAVVQSPAALLVSRTALDGALEVLRFDLTQSLPLEASDGRVILRIPYEAEFHHGGSMVVLGDGDLLLSTGDGWIRPREAQSLDSPYGKVLRIPEERISGQGEVDPVDMDVLALGLRNPWQMSVDSET